MARTSRFLEVTALDPGGVTVQESRGVVKPLELGGHPGGVGYSVGTMIERQPRILAFAGSLRKGSFNRMLLRYAILGAREAGGDVEELGPEHLTLPLYNGDLEASGSFPGPSLSPTPRTPSMRTANLKKRGRFRRSRLLVARSSRRFGPVSRASSRLSLAAQRELHGDLHHALHGARAATGGHERPLLYGAERSVVED